MLFSDDRAMKHYRLNMHVHDVIVFRDSFFFVRTETDFEITKTRRRVNNRPKRLKSLTFLVLRF